MSSFDNNITFKKTSFLSGINSEFINQLYSDYLSDPKSLPKGWKKFFEGLSEDERRTLVWILRGSSKDYHGMIYGSL